MSHGTAVDVVLPSQTDQEKERISVIFSFFLILSFRLCITDICSLTCEKTTRKLIRVTIKIVAKLVLQYFSFKHFFFPELEIFPWRGKAFFHSLIERVDSLFYREIKRNKKKNFVLLLLSKFQRLFSLMG